MRARERKIVVGRLEQQRAPGCLCRARSAGAAVSCLEGVREVVEEWGDVMVEAGCACVCARGCSRDEVLGDGRARAYLLPEEMRAVVEAASPM